jgi:3,4-dihydroxy-2-butanone 4-phosphate synthase
MSLDFFIDSMASILKEQGVSNPLQVAEKAAADLNHAKLIDPGHIETMKAHAEIYEMRKTMTCTEIAKATGRSRVGVSKIIKEQYAISKRL